MIRLFLLLTILAPGISLKAQKLRVLPVGSIDTLQVDEMVMTYYTYGPLDSQSIRHIALIFPTTAGVDPATERLAYELVQAGDLVCIPVLPQRSTMRGMERVSNTFSRSEVNLAAARLTNQLVEEYATSSGFICVGVGAGATQALYFSTVETQIKSTLLFYVHEPLLPSLFARLRAPVHAFVGEEEMGVDRYVNHMQKYMYANGKQFKVHLISGASDGFLGIDDPRNSRAATMALQEMRLMLQP